MAHWFRLLRGLLQPMTLLCAVAILASCSARSDASIILCTLPDPTVGADATLQDKSPQVWPWISPAPPTGSQGNGPPVKLAPELKISESAEARSSRPLSMNFGAIAVNVVSERLARFDGMALRQHLDGVVERAIQWRDAMSGETFAGHWYRLEQSVLTAEQSPLEAAPPVAASMQLVGRPTVSVEALASLSHRMIDATGLDSKRIAGSLNAAWGWQPTATAIADPFDGTDVGGVTESGNSLLPSTAKARHNLSQHQKVATTVPISALARPLVRWSAKMLNDAGTSLQTLACGLSELGEGPLRVGRAQGTAESANLAEDPAARFYFGPEQ